MLGEGTSRIYNIVSIIFLTLTALMLVFVLVTLVSGGDEEPIDFSGLPTSVQLPTLTPTLTPSITPTSTFTSIPTFTPTATITVPPTNTAPPTPTITDTPGPTLTPSDTPTPSLVPSETATPTPTGPTPTRTPTRSPFLFDVLTDVFIGPNSVNSAGCAWQGVGGSVLDLNGNEIAQQYQVRVIGNGIDRTVFTGSNSIYGPVSGWEVALGSTISQQTVFVRLETAIGTQISPEIQITFPGDCNANSAIVRFQQVQPFGATAIPPTVPGP
jgi:hypothetical protein